MKQVFINAADMRLIVETHFPLFGSTGAANVMEKVTAVEEVHSQFEPVELVIKNPQIEPWGEEKGQPHLYRPSTHMVKMEAARAKLEFGPMMAYTELVDYITVYLRPEILHLRAELKKAQFAGRKNKKV